MTSWKYDLPTMERFIADLDTRIQNLTSKHEDIGRTASQLAEQYTGEAATAFGSAHTQWQDTAAQHLSELKAFRQQIEVCRSNYAEARAANRQMLC
jgi:WXG100 family type VII secretion target